MKTVGITLWGVFGLLLVAPAFSQNRAEVYNDPTYSTHNYKHPNKAIEAQRVEASIGTNVPAATSTDRILADYKPQIHSNYASGSITVDYKSPRNTGDWNYKTQQSVHSQTTTHRVGNARHRSNAKVA
ncbi:hypothetical protein [Spirosoma endbachense]|uniref:Uncharacterized protein n=1 Tax=Spirosoma endbachense TaxID=2666025 RepID=A0A6P1VNI7_9BACT|nr:hypothetical protein [Spirosoma endbachense]QHV94653.1 hypothetical protein GJR95_06345 [Spirosoma endbachense]